MSSLNQNKSKTPQVHPLNKTPWYGSTTYCEKLGSLFTDSSLEKSKRLEKISQQKSFKLKKQYETLNSSLSLHRSINSRVELYSQDLSSYFASVSHLENEKLRMDSAATIIQKHFRGHQARIANSSSLIQAQKNLLKKKTEDLEIDSEYLLFKFGRNLDLATKKIQKAVLRFLFRRKLKRFEIFYENILFHRDKLKMEKLLRYSFVFFCRFRVNHARFLRNRERKMVRIKRKLAILSIKNVINREKIILKNLKIGIRRYKRRITLGLITSSKAEGETHEDEAQTNKTEEEAKIARMKLMIELEEAKRKKIKLGKISYKVPKPKYFNLKNRVRKSPDQENSESSSSPSQRHQKVLPVLTPEPNLKAKIDRFRNLKSNYMATTQSFQFSVKGPAWMNEVEPEKPKIEMKKLRKTIYQPTKFSEIKMKKKKVFSKSEKPEWCSFSLVRETYVPSIFTFSHDEERIGELYHHKPLRRVNRFEFAEKLKTSFENKYVRELAFTPVSARFEEALPELSKFNKMYPSKKGTQAFVKTESSRKDSSLNLFVNF